EPVEEPKEEPVAAELPEPTPAVAEQPAQSEQSVVAPSTDVTAEAPPVAASPEIIPEPVVVPPSNVVPLAARKRGGSAFGWVMTAVAASLA
ncbi:hypothetical protein ABTM08_19855, partial [Acinetobacter baumannii]